MHPQILPRIQLYPLITLHTPSPLKNSTSQPTPNTINASTYTIRTKRSRPHAAELRSAGVPRQYTAVGHHMLAHLLT